MKSDPAPSTPLGAAPPSVPPPAAAEPLPAALPAVASLPAAATPPASAPKLPPLPVSGRLLTALFFIALIALLKVAQPLLLPIAVAVILTFVLTPGVRWLRRRGIAPALGAALLVATLIGVTALLGAALSGPALQWLERAPETMSRLIARIDRIRESIPLLAPPRQPAQAPAPRISSRSAPVPMPAPAPQAAAQPDPIKDKIASETMALTGEVLGGTLTFAIAAAATVILLYFLLASEYWLLSSTIAAIPRRRTRALVLSGVRAAQTEISHFLGVLAVINICVGTATGFAIWTLGLDNPVLWGALAAGLNFIPYIGPLIMATLLLLAGLLAFENSAFVLAPALAFFAVHFVEANFVTPTFVGRRLSLSPVAVFLSVMFWAWMWGIAGAVIAVPLLVGLRSVCKRNRRWKLLCVYLEGGQKAPLSLGSLVRVRRRTLPPSGF